MKIGKIFDKIWQWKRIITDSSELEPLMIRYYLTPKIFGLRLCIHHFLHSDNDRHYHDHPWNFISFIFKGSYIEHSPGWKKEINDNSDDKNITAPRIIQRSKNWKHWVELPKNGDAWTLVLFYGRRRDWGFWTI